MGFIYQVIYQIVHFIESVYSELVRVLWDELIHGESNYSQIEALLGFLFFCGFAIFSFYLEGFVDLAMIIALLAFFYAQIDNIGEQQIKFNQGEPFSSLFREAFYAFSMMCFLIVFANLLPKAGHFIMFFVGPSFGVNVPTLELDLSLNGIWGVFSFEMDIIDKVEFSILFLSFVISSLTFFRKS